VERVSFRDRFHAQRAVAAALHRWFRHLLLLERNTSKDRDDADHLFRTHKLDSQGHGQAYLEMRLKIEAVFEHYATQLLWKKLFVG
jgi:hypothetical protein